MGTKLTNPVDNVRSNLGDLSNCSDRELLEGSRRDAADARAMIGALSSQIWTFLRNQDRINQENDERLSELEAWRREMERWRAEHEARCPALKDTGS